MTGCAWCADAERLIARRTPADLIIDYYATTPAVIARHLADHGRPELARVIDPTSVPPPPLQPTLWD